jgi:hypothetical protein
LPAAVPGRSEQVPPRPAEACRRRSDCLPGHTAPRGHPARLTRSLRQSRSSCPPRSLIICSIQSPLSRTPEVYQRRAPDRVRATLCARTRRWLSQTRGTPGGGRPMRAITSHRSKAAPLDSNSAGRWRHL